jgi:adenylate cyclase
MDYTVIGDGVNIAARLESATKQYGAHILISEYTYAQLKGTYRSRQVDRVVVKGKTEPVGVFELLDYHTAESFPNIVKALGKFRDGMRCYRAGQWQRGRDKFATVLKINPGDACSQVYVERCEYLMENADPKDWDGIWTLTSK